MQILLPLWGFPGGLEGKASAYNVGDPGSIPRSGSSPGEGNGNPLQYSCMENPMDRGAWWAKESDISAHINSKYIKRNETWMKLETMLSEINKTQRDNIVWFQLYVVHRAVKFRDRKSSRSYQGLGLGAMENYYIKVIGFLFGVMKKFQK